MNKSKRPHCLFGFGKIAIALLVLSVGVVACGKNEIPNVPALLGAGQGSGAPQSGSGQSSDSNSSNGSSSNPTPPQTAQANLTGTDCFSSVQDTKFVNPAAPTSLSSADQKKWQDVLTISPRLTARKYFYRWGSVTFEAPRIGKNQIFTISPAANDVNAGGGGMAAGVGLYLANTPLETQNYGGSSLSRLYTVSVAEGTPVIASSDATTYNTLSANGISNTDIQWFKTGYSNTNNYALPILHEYYFGNSAYVRNSQGVNKYVYADYAWVLKTPIEAKFEEEFTGKELPTSQLISYVADADTSGSLIPGNKKSVREYYLDRIKDTLRTRIYNPDPNYKEKLPTPPEMIYEKATWSSLPQFAQFGQCNLGAPTKNRHFWRFDGSCGEYTTSGYNLIHDNVAKQNCYNEWPASGGTKYSYCINAAKTACYEYLEVNANTYILTEKEPLSKCNAGALICDEKTGVAP